MIPSDKMNCTLVFIKLYSDFHWYTYTCPAAKCHTALVSKGNSPKRLTELIGWRGLVNVFYNVSKLWYRRQNELYSRFYESSTCARIPAMCHTAQASKGKPQKLVNRTSMYSSFCHLVGWINYRIGAQPRKIRIFLNAKATPRTVTKPLS